VAGSLPPLSVSPSPFPHICPKVEKPEIPHEDWDELCNQVGREVSPERPITDDMEQYFKKMESWRDYIHRRVLQHLKLLGKDVKAEEFEEKKKKYLERLREDTAFAMTKDEDFNRIVRSLMRERPVEFNDDAFRYMFTDDGFKRSTYGLREILKGKLHGALGKQFRREGVHSFTLIVDSSCIIRTD
jgi:hypothetical protein